MNKEKIKAEVIEILTSKKFKSLQIKSQGLDDNISLLNEIGLDSIQILELIVAIEKRFEFSFNTMELKIDIFDKLSDLVDFIHSNITEKVS